MVSSKKHDCYYGKLDLLDDTHLLEIGIEATNGPDLFLTMIYGMFDARFR